MARQKEAYGKKIVYRYSGGVIFTILFSLMAIAIFVLSLFFPLIATKDASIESPIKGLDFVYLAIDLFTGNTNELFTSYRESITTHLFDGFGVADAVINVMFYEMAVILLIMAIYAVILAIGTLVMIFKGHLKHWKLPYSITKRMFIFSFSYYGLVVGINVYSLIAQKGYTYDGLISYIFFGGLFVLTIILHIIYGICFKKHVYVKNEAQLKEFIDEMEKDNVVTDTSKNSNDVVIQEAPKVKETPKPINPVVNPIINPVVTPKNDSSDNRKYLPKGLKNIGGHAFSQNTALEIADIPLGIETLGAGAFANCVNLREVHIPESVKKIEYNCFFNCMRLKRITYGGSREMWKKIKRGSNWLASAGTKFVVCIDGALTVDPEH